MKSFFRKIVFLIIFSVVATTTTEYRTMRCPDEVILAETAPGEDAVFEKADYAHTLRTIDHMLRGQRAEVACIPTLTNGETKTVFVSPPYANVQRSLLHQRTAISLLATDHPIRTRYITYPYYVYTLERILI